MRRAPKGSTSSYFCCSLIQITNHSSSADSPAKSCSFIRWLGSHLFSGITHQEISAKIVTAPIITGA